MEEDSVLSDDAAKNGKRIIVEEGMEKVKDFVYKNFKEGTDDSLVKNTEQTCTKGHGISLRKETPSVNKAHCKNQQGAVFSGKILSFGCSVCQDGLMYSPNDLLKHFRATHHGILPRYPCDLCGFVTYEFPALQRHRMEHRNAMATCEICNDEVEYSLLMLTRHYIACHSKNGRFACKLCGFTTVDAGTFVQHIHHHNESSWKCFKCKHSSLSQAEHHKHMKGHSGKFLFMCQICAYGATRSECLQKHMLAVHKEETVRQKTCSTGDDSSSPAGSVILKAMLNKCSSITGALQEYQRNPELNCHSELSCPPNQNGWLLNEEEINHFDGMLENDNKLTSKISEQSDSVGSFQECDHSASADQVNYNNPNGLTVLMVKNKISLPPNCTTKVIGFKVVGGKKHLVLKVIPAAKQELSIQTFTDAASQNLGMKSKERFENGDCPDITSSLLYSFSHSFRNGSCLQRDQDGMAVKLNIETEAKSEYCLLSPAPNRVHRQTTPSPCADEVHPVTSDFEDVGDQSHSYQSTCSERSSFNDIISESCDTDENTQCGAEISNNVFTDKDAGTSLPTHAVNQTLSKVAVVENIDNPDDAVSISVTVTDALSDKHKDNWDLNATEGDQFLSSQEHAGSVTEMKPHTEDPLQMDTPQNLKEIIMTIPDSPEKPSTVSHKEKDSLVLSSSVQNSPNQEVFTFHNYSKEIVDISAEDVQEFDDLSEITDEESECESTHFTLTLAESPEPFTGDSGDESSQNESLCDHEKSIKNVPHGDSEVDCISRVEDPPTECVDSEAVLQDFNIIKIEEENIPISNNDSETIEPSASLGRSVEEPSASLGRSVEEPSVSLRRSVEEPSASLSRSVEEPSASLGRSVEEPSGAFTQKVSKESMNFSSANSSSGLSKATLQILQLSDGKQPVLLRTIDNKVSMPVKFTTAPGFKIIANSTNPQINFTCMKAGFEKANNTSGATFSSSTRIGVLAPRAEAVEKGVTLLSAVQPGVGTISNRVLINSTGHKGPVLFTSTSPFNTADKTLKTQPTCYLVQRSVPLVQTSSTSGPKLANVQQWPGSRPVFAMPVSSLGKATTLQPVRLFRCFSPAKPGIFLNNQNAKMVTQCSQISGSSGNKVLLKLIAPSSDSASAPPNSSYKPVFLATGSHTQCLLLPANISKDNVPAGMTKLVTIQSTAEGNSTESISQLNVTKQGETDRTVRAPSPVQPAGKRKRHTKELLQLPVAVHKARRLENKEASEKETTGLWQPVAKDVESKLRIVPFRSRQTIKYPRRHQPVVVLNHPDADIPEVANIMKVVSRHRGAVAKVALSQKTVDALSELDAAGKTCVTADQSEGQNPRPRPLHSAVRERFLLKLKLKKKSKKKYEVVDNVPGCRGKSAVFECWFCGRLFNNQEDWIGHGQRHLMEATRDWNKLF
ncbi:zinc finger protein 518A-like [Thalassophryne amazonica]|uniref:zinc finger protein 518A-like n=1 Tax=Thalassophryne amazonica TaxID=390379 RepID=UPI001471B047|nr:zinc finger protein 518A-like [Thalassophryne amazonica]